MTPITIQALFNIYYDVVFFVIVFRLYQVYKKDCNLFTRYLLLAFLSGAIEYLFIALPLLLTPTNFLLIKIAGFIAWVFSLGFVWFGWVALASIFPKFPLKITLFFLSLAWTTILILYFIPFHPAYINQAGIMDWGHTTTMIIGGMLFSITSLILGILFIYHSIRHKFFLKAATFGIGLATYLTFLPLTYQVHTFDMFILMNILASLGFILMAVGMFVGQIYKKQAITN